MRAFGATAAAVALCTGGAANAQAANQTFECAQPYREAMQSLASLTVTAQTSDPGLPILLKRASQTVEFDPGATLVFGHAPTKLSFTAAEPLPDEEEPVYQMTFEAALPRTAAVHQSIDAANTWHLGLCAEGLTLCSRADSAEPEGIGKLRYYRRVDEPIRIECIFEFTPEELEALGE